MNIATLDLPRHTAACAVLWGVSLALLACTSVGAGTGSLSPGDVPVVFNWTSQDGGNTGTMAATPDNGGSTVQAVFEHS